MTTRSFDLFCWRPEPVYKRFSPAVNAFDYSTVLFLDDSQVDRVASVSGAQVCAVVKAVK